jgi:Spy/CpxP family protein refolding chaperone
MKKIIAFTMMLAIAGFSASAQERREMKGDKQGMHKMHGQKGDMAKDLNLTEAQKAQLKADRETYKAKLEALRKEENITVKEMKARQKAIHDEQKSKMEALLTPEQKAKIAADRSNMEASRKQMEGKRANMMKEKLGLSNEQAEKLKAHNQEVHAKIKSIQDNQSLTAEQKQAQMKAVKETSKTQRKSILTTEQIQRMEEMKKDGKGRGIKGGKGAKPARVAK